MNLITEGLLQSNHQVKILAVNTSKHFVDVNQLPDSYRKSTSVETVFIDTTVKPLHAFFNLFTNKSYHISRFISDDFGKRLADILQSDTFDIVQLESLYVCPYIEIVRKYSAAKIVYRAHNIEHLIWERIYKSSANVLKKWYLKILTHRLKKYEISILNKVDGIASITDFDAGILKKMGCTKPIVTIPIGINDHAANANFSSYEFPSFFHIGSMNWIPNTEGIRWFISNVWFPFHKEYPDIRFYLAGRHMPDYFKKLEGIQVINIGEVPDASVFMQSKAVMIVPLLSGSGMRVKIIEAMANSKAIISTTIGAEGINCTAGENILLADTPGEFLKAMKKCVSDKGYTDKIARNARLLVENEYYNTKIIATLIEFYKKIC